MEGGGLGDTCVSDFKVALASALRRHIETAGFLNVQQCHVDSPFVKTGFQAVMSAFKLLNLAHRSQS